MKHIRNVCPMLCFNAKPYRACKKYRLPMSVILCYLFEDVLCFSKYYRNAFGIFHLWSSNIIQIPPIFMQLRSLLSELRYLAAIEVSKGVPAPVPSKGCSCKGECYDVTKCSCAKLNGKKFPYVSRNGGRYASFVTVFYLHIIMSFYF